MAFAQILTLLFGAIGILGGIGVFFNGGRKDSYIKILTEENISLSRQKTEAISDNARLTAERDGYKRQVDDTLKKYEDAKELAQGSPQLRILITKFDEQTRVIERYLKENTK